MYTSSPPHGNGTREIGKKSSMILALVPQQDRLVLNPGLVLAQIEILYMGRYLNLSGAKMMVRKWAPEYYETMNWARLQRNRAG